MFAARGGFNYTTTTVVGDLSFIASFNAGASPAASLASSNGANVYFIGSISTGSEIMAIKLNSAGNVVWQKAISGTSGNVEQTTDAVLDSSENIYMCGRQSVATANYQGYLCKLDTTGNIVWQRSFGSTYNQDNEPGVSVESGGNVFIVLNGNNAVNMAMYNSSGTLQYQRQQDANADTAVDITSTTGNCYMIGQGGNNGYLTKINTSGTTQNSRTIQQTGETIVPIAITADSTGNLFVLSRRTGGNIVVSKHYSNTDIISSVSYANLTNASGGIAVDTSDNVYVASTGASNLAWYAKLYNGNLESQWQRTFTTGNATVFRNISWANSHVYIAGAGNIGGAVNTPFIAKLPDDGTGEGTHGIYTIANVTYATSSGSFTSSTAANATTSTLTGATPTLTASDSSLTQTLTTL